MDAPFTLNGVPTLSNDCCSVYRSADDLDSSPYIQTSLAPNSGNTGGNTVRSLHTFKPRSALKELFHPGSSAVPISPKHAVSSTIGVTRYSCPGSVVHREDNSPYYFKMDPLSSSAAFSANGRRVAAENAMNSMAESEISDLKPDVLPGCAECKEQNRLSNTVV